MKNYILFASLLSIIFIPVAVISQCQIKGLQSTAYLTGECGGYSFQSAVGSLSAISGSCGGLFFTPPLTGGDFTSNVAGTAFSEIRIFPNPALDFLIINGLQSSAYYTADIFSSTGTLLVKSEFVREDTPVPIADLETGLYFIKIYSNDLQIVIHKFIKI